VQGMLVKAAIRIISLYQKHFPNNWKRHCLYVPSCSQYMVLALQKYGFQKGLKMGIQRIRRCKPPVLEWEDYP
jgi:putative component of membrane protein insertase Oxa1/YidC/SpoIIIJ protein YidD